MTNNTKLVVQAVGMVAIPMVATYVIVKGTEGIAKQELKYAAEVSLDFEKAQKWAKIRGVIFTTAAVTAACSGTVLFVNKLYNS